MEQLGYIRVSTVSQNTGRQLDGLQLDKVFTDKCSGGDTDRPGLSELLDYARDGDTVHVHSIDRMARNLQDLERIVSSMNIKGITVRFAKEGLVFSPRGKDGFDKLMLQILGAVAEFERTMIRERQAEGIAKAKQAGKYKGRKPIKDELKAAILSQAEAGKPKTKIAADLGISRQTVYKVLSKEATN